MKQPNVVLDTNVVVSALRSREGASYRLIGLLDSSKFKFHLSVALVVEYEAALKKPGMVPHFSVKEKDAFLDYLCSIGIKRKIHYLWRPNLKDPADDMVLELAVAAGVKYIITFNKSDFAGSDKLGVAVVTPQEFLRILGEIP